MYPRLSWSTLQAYEECPQRYFLWRQRKRKLIPEKFTLVGNTLHYTSEQLILGSMSESKIVESAVLDYSRRVQESTSLGWSQAEITENMQRVHDGAWRLIEIYSEEFNSVNLRDIIPELHLYRFYETWCLEGYMDLAVVFAGSRGEIEKVYDVKTGTSHKRGQLEFYSVLVEAYQGVRPEKLAFIEPLARGVVEVKVSREDHDAMKTRIMKAAMHIKKNEFPTDGFPKACFRCSSEPFCPATERARNGKLV